MSVHFKTAKDAIRRSPFQALSAIAVLSLTFFMATTLAVMVYASHNILKYFEGRPQVIAFLKDEITPVQISALQNKLARDSRVSQVRYVSKEEALEIYKKGTADNPLLSELVSPSIFPASLEFSLTNLSKAQEVINEVKTEAIVSQVGFTASLGGEKTLQDVVSKLKNVIFYLRLGGGIFVGLLALTSLFILLVIIGMRIAARKGEIEILDLLGATSGFIRSPFLWEALIYCLIGVFVGWLLAFILWLYLTPNILSYFGEIPVLPKKIVDLGIFFGLVLLAEMIVGSFLGICGSFFAVGRANKAK